MPKKQVETANVDITRKGIWVYGKDGYYNVCNFGLKILYRIQNGYGEISWLLAVQLPGGEDVTMSLSNKNFATPGSFHECLLREGFVFRGEKAALNAIKEALIPASEQAEAIASLGYHQKSGLFFWFNGATTPQGAFLSPDNFGMIRHENCAYYLPFTQDAEGKNYKTLARMTYQTGPTTLPKWAAMVAAAHGQKALIPVCFRLAAYFRDVAFQQAHFFPLLYLRGVPGAGKSTCARSMTAIDGRTQEDLNLKSPNTTKSIPRRLEQISDSIVWFDEYANDLNEGVIGTLQAVYDGGGYQRAVNGYSNLTNSIDIHSAVILTSNYTPNTEFMRQRCVFISYTDTKRSEAQTLAYNRLIDAEIGNLSSVAAEILSHRKLIAHEWKPTHTALFKYLTKKLPHVESRICNNIAVIMTPARILEKRNVLNLQEIFGLKDSLQETAMACCLRQQEILTGKSDLAQFFEVLAYSAERRLIREGEDYIYSKDGQTLAMRMPRVYPVYMQQFRALYNRVGNSREDIQNEIARHECFIKNCCERFRVVDGKGWAGYPAIKLDVAKMGESFPLFLDRNPEFVSETR